ncbi:MAG: hypothetical protein ACI8Z1_002146 [Candidatus Azotimanducaceae bacterium]
MQATRNEYDQTVEHVRKILGSFFSGSGLLASSAQWSAETMAGPGEYVCRDGNKQRIISVEYPHKGWWVPCRVKYEKPAEGITTYPWQAEATPGYCEDKAEYLAQKLSGFG